MKSARKMYLFMGTMFLIFGLVFLSVSAGLWQSGRQLMANGVSAQGEYIRVGRSNTWIRYLAEGQVWEIRSDFYSSSMRVGDSVTVWYMPGQPETARAVNDGMLAGWLAGGGLFVAFGAFFLGAGLKQLWLKRSLSANGTRVVAQVFLVQQNKYVRINHAHPYVIYAKCIHPYTGQEIEVKSGFLMKDPSDKIKDWKIGVLVDPMRESRYYMQVEEIG